MLTRKVRNTDFEVYVTQVQIPALALNSCVALGRLLNHSTSLLTIKRGNNNSVVGGTTVITREIAQC